GQALLPPRMIRDIVVDPTDLTGHTAYAVFSGFSFVQAGVNDPKGHVFKTTDLGATWTDISCTVANCSSPAGTDFPNPSIHSLVIDPDLPATLYLRTDIGGLHG